MGTTRILVVGDVHGHLQLALCVAARWQEELRAEFDAVLLCGDVGVFPDVSKLDRATLRHAERNPCEIEFPLQWATEPPAPWLDSIFLPKEDGGLGLLCPVAMVHGNHEDFDHLASLVQGRPPAEAVPMGNLPAVDPGLRIRYIPSGWKAATPSGLVVAAVGGIEDNRRKPGRHPLAWIDEGAVLNLAAGGPTDVLITHQGPSGAQEDHGSETLQILLDAQVASLWFHGHSVRNPDPPQTGRTRVVPLDDIPFSGSGARGGEAGEGGWAIASFEDGTVQAAREKPPFLSDFNLNRWRRRKDGLLICPPLAYLRSWE
jgi:predicted phosphodiesterase